MSHVVIVDFFKFGSRSLILEALKSSATAELYSDKSLNQIYFSHVYLLPELNIASTKAASILIKNELT